MASATAPRCVCELRRSGTVIQVDDLPADGITDEADHALVVNVAKYMLVLHHPRISAMNWVVDEHEDETAGVHEYHVVVRWPQGTSFNVRKLALIEQLNELNIADVIVEPQTDSVNLRAIVRKCGAPRDIVVDEILVIQQRWQAERTQQSNRVTKKRRTSDEQM